MTPYWRRRLARHAALAAACAMAVAGLTIGLQSADLIWKLSLSTAWGGTVLLVVTLAIGPLNVLRQRPNPVSTDLRRDVGIWAAILALGHTGVGLFVHLRGRPWLYFLSDRPLVPAMPIRVDTFGLANWSGLAGSFIAAGLLLLSNDWSLRRLGPARWKSLQRWNYVLAGLMAGHGLVYQLMLEERPAPFVLVFVGLLAGAVLLQAVGFLRTRRVRTRGDQRADRAARKAAGAK